MKFKMNNRTWEIVEAEPEYLLQEYNNEFGDISYCFGFTKISDQKICINKELCQDQKKQTLYHELMHCYIWCYIHNFDEIGIEALCDISANSHDIIHKIVEDYFKE